MTAAEIIEQLKLLDPKTEVKAQRINRDGECWAYTLNSISQSTDHATGLSEAIIQLKPEFQGQDNDE